MSSNFLLSSKERADFIEKMQEEFIMINNYEASTFKRMFIKIPVYKIAGVFLRDNLEEITKLLNSKSLISAPKKERKTSKAQKQKTLNSLLASVLLYQLSNIYRKIIYREQLCKQGDSICDFIKIENKDGGVVKVEGSRYAQIFLANTLTKELLSLIFEKKDIFNNRFFDKSYLREKATNLLREQLVKDSTIIPKKTVDTLSDLISLYIRDTKTIKDAKKEAKKLLRDDLELASFLNNANILKLLSERLYSAKSTKLTYKIMIDEEGIENLASYLIKIS